MKGFSIIKIITAAVLLAAFFIVLNLTGFAKTFKNSFYSISSPVQKKIWQTGARTSDFLTGILKIKILERELDLVYLKNRELIGQVAALREFKKENEVLREALNIGLKKEFRLKLTRMVGIDVSQDSLLINKGEKDGISKGMPAITGQKVLLGRIGEVYRDFSEVVLISSKKSSFDAKISEKEIYGMAKGEGSFKLFLDLIPKDKEVSEGDLVVTAALGGIYPEGILIGEIKKIKKSDVESLQTAEIKPGFNIKKLDYLFIIADF